ncbi:SPOR domain-containing protein [Parasphingorhabdus sp.]|uniref:SPOR domain-containing protein n=1 Tax=Parasphingorhabdus sp. TaxID=2709688 RepID=UPI002F94787E
MPAVPAQAQYANQEARNALQDALRRIASNPNNSSALADAGLAALELGDTRAAIGFLAKADEIYPNSGRVKAGLARALLLERNPFGALRYFDEAIKHGTAVKDIAVDRGMAFDLIGRNADAQKDYALAFGHERSDTLLKRYAISLGISGDVEGAEAKLEPLLLKSDRDAWRTRAFILAMNGKEKEANKIASQTMQKEMAKAIKPFFDNMPKLTPAQKAAAVHFGHFPASANIGVDVATVRYASQSARRGSEGADAGLIPMGEPLGEESEKTKVLAMPDTKPRRRPGTKSTRKEKKAAAVSARVPNGKMGVATASLPAPENARPLVTPVDAGASNRAATGTAQPSAGFETALGGGDSADEKARTGMAGQASGAAKPSLVSQSVTRKVDIGDVRAPAEPAREPLERRSLSEIIESISIPETTDNNGVVPVDLASITPARPKPKVQPVAEKPAVKEKAKPEPPKYPKRYWVQIATGSDIKALKFDFNRIIKKNPDLFTGLEGWTSPWGQTRRMVVGPFADMQAAKKFEAGFRKAGGDGFAWVSNDGTVVNKLD